MKYFSRQKAKSLITKTCLYNFDPLKPHFHIVKLGFTRVYIIFLISAQNIDCGYSLEPPRRGGSNEYPQSMFWAEIWKISEFFSWKVSVLEVKFYIYLNRRVFVMGLRNIGHCDQNNFMVKRCVILTHNRKVWCLHMKFSSRYKVKSLDHEI